MRYSKSTGGFYADDIEYRYLPSDVILITDDEHVKALTAGPDRLDVIDGKFSIRPARPSDQYIWKDGAWTLDADLQAAAEAATRTALCTQIDDAVAAIYTRYARFSDEYTLRLSQAQAYKDAGYTGAVPEQVAAYATPAVVTAQAAADLIIAQAAALSAAIAQLGVLRMRKYEVKAAASVADAEAIATSVLAAISAVSDALK